MRLNGTHVETKQLSISSFVGLRCDEQNHTNNLIYKRNYVDRNQGDREREQSNRFYYFSNNALKSGIKLAKHSKCAQTENIEH